MSCFPDQCAPNEDPQQCDVPSGTYYEILNKSDLYAGLVAVIQNYIGSANYGSGGMAMPAVMATVVSATSRALTTYAVGFGGKDSYLPVMNDGLTPTTSNLLFVGIFNAVIAFLMKRNVAKQTLLGLEIDSLGYTLMQNMPYMNPNDSIIFGWKKA